MTTSRNFREGRTRLPRLSQRAIQGPYPISRIQAAPVRKYTAELAEALQLPPEIVGKWFYDLLVDVEDPLDPLDPPVITPWLDYAAVLFLQDYPAQLASFGYVFADGQGNPQLTARVLQLFDSFGPASPPQPPGSLFDVFKVDNELGSPVHGVVDGLHVSGFPVQVGLGDREGGQPESIGVWAVANSATALGDAPAASFGSGAVPDPTVRLQVLLHIGDADANDLRAGEIEIFNPLSLMNPDARPATGVISGLYGQFADGGLNGGMFAGRAAVRGGGEEPGGGEG